MMPVVNKRFLKNTLVSTLRQPYKPPSRNRGGRVQGLDDREKTSSTSGSSRSSRSSSGSSRSSRSYSSSSSSSSRSRSRSRGKKRKRHDKGQPQGPWLGGPDPNAYYEWAATMSQYGGYPWFYPGMEAYPEMYCNNNPEFWAAYRDFYGIGNFGPGFRGRGGMMRGHPRGGWRGRGRGRGSEHGNMDGGPNEQWGNQQPYFHDRRSFSRSRSRSGSRLSLSPSQRNRRRSLSLDDISNSRSRSSSRSKKKSKKSNADAMGSKSTESSPNRKEENEKVQSRSGSQELESLKKKSVKDGKGKKKKIKKVKKKSVEGEKEKTSLNVDGEAVDGGDKTGEASTAKGKKGLKKKVGKGKGGKKTLKSGKKGKKKKVVGKQGKDEMSKGNNGVVADTVENKESNLDGAKDMNVMDKLRDAESESVQKENGGSQSTIDDINSNDQVNDNKVGKQTNDEIKDAKENDNDVVVTDEGGNGKNEDMQLKQKAEEKRYQGKNLIGLNDNEDGESGENRKEDRLPKDKYGEDVQHKDRLDIDEHDQNENIPYGEKHRKDKLGENIREEEKCSEDMIDYDNRSKERQNEDRKKGDKCEENRYSKGKRRNSNESERRDGKYDQIEGSLDKDKQSKFHKRRYRKSGGDDDEQESSGDDRRNEMKSIRNKDVRDSSRSGDESGDADEEWIMKRKRGKHDNDSDSGDLNRRAKLSRRRRNICGEQKSDSESNDNKSSDIDRKKETVRKKLEEIERRLQERKAQLGIGEEETEEKGGSVHEKWDRKNVRKEFDGLEHRSNKRNTENLNREGCFDALKKGDRRSRSSQDREDDDGKYNRQLPKGNRADSFLSQRSQPYNQNDRSRRWEINEIEYNNSKNRKKRNEISRDDNYRQQRERKERQDSEEGDMNKIGSVRIRGLYSDKMANNSGFQRQPAVSRNRNEFYRDSNIRLHVNERDTRGDGGRQFDRKGRCGENVDCENISRRKRRSSPSNMSDDDGRMLRSERRDKIQAGHSHSNRLPKIGTVASHMLSDDDDDRRPEIRNRHDTGKEYSEIIRRKRGNLTTSSDDDYEETRVDRRNDRNRLKIGAADQDFVRDRRNDRELSEESLRKKFIKKDNKSTSFGRKDSYMKGEFQNENRDRGDRKEFGVGDRQRKEQQMRDTSPFQFSKDKRSDTGFQRSNFKRERSNDSLQRTEMSRKDLKVSVKDKVDVRNKKGKTTLDVEVPVIPVDSYRKGLQTLNDVKKLKKKGRDDSGEESEQSSVGKKKKKKKKEKVSAY